MAKHESSELLHYIEKSVVTLMTANSIDPKLSQKVVTGLLSELATEWGGQSLYFPIRRSSELRNKQIHADFNGTNVKALSKKYKLCEQSIYNILKENKA